MILDELKSKSPNFDKLCIDTSEIQRLTQSGNKGCNHEKEVHLSSIDGKRTFTGKCRNCGKVCEYKAAECKKHKGHLHGGCSNDSKEGNTGHDGSIKTCSFCQVKGHKDAQYFQKFPEKAPAWWKEKNAKTYSAALNVEVSLMSFVESLNQGVNMTSLKAKGDDTLAMLHQENVWICVTSASTHVTWSDKCTRNVHDTKIYSLGYTV